MHVLNFSAFIIRYFTVKTEAWSSFKSLITSPKTTVKYCTAVKTCDLIFNSYDDILFPRIDYMNAFLTHWLIFLFPYYYFRLSAVEKVSFFGKRTNKSMVIFTLGGNKEFFFLCNGIELMEHLSPGTSFEVLTVVMMKISIFRDMT